MDKYAPQGVDAHKIAKRSISNEIASAQVKAWDKLEKTKSRTEIDAIIEQLQTDAGLIFKKLGINTTE